MEVRKAFLKGNFSLFIMFLATVKKKKKERKKERKKEKKKEKKKRKFSSLLLLAAPVGH